MNDLNEIRKHLLSMAETASEEDKYVLEIAAAYLFGATIAKPEPTISKGEWVTDNVFHAYEYYGPIRRT